MEETENSFKVKQTVSLEELLSSLPQNSYPVAAKIFHRVFDENPVKEVREACINKLCAEWDFEVDWLTKRVKAYLEIGDYPTVFMLLRVLAGHEGESQKDILGLMVETVKSCLQKYPHYLKETLVILCGKIHHHPELYDETVKEVFQSILEKYDGKERYISDKKYRLLLRVFLSIGRVGDKTFLPLLRRNIPDQEYLAELMRYASVSKDEIIAEGIRLLVIRYLENLKS